MGNAAVGLQPLSSTCCFSLGNRIMLCLIVFPEKGNISHVVLENCVALGSLKFYVCKYSIQHGILTGIFLLAP